MMEIKTHVVKTEMILKKINFEGIYRDVPEVAGAHHEKFDGTGYPKGLERLTDTSWSTDTGGSRCL